MSSPDEALSAASETASTEACAYTEYESGGASAAYPKTGEDATGAEAEVWEALSEVEDPEMPVSVVDLGLIYDVTVDGERASVEMTLTYTGCPARDMLTGEVKDAAASVEGVADAEVVLVWSPGWSVELVTDQGREDLREFGLSVPDPS